MAYNNRIGNLVFLHATLEEKAEGIPGLNNQLDSEDPQEKLLALSFLTQLVYLIPAAQIIEIGMLPKIAAALTHPNPKIQYYASWCVTNLALDHEATQQLVKFGVVESLITLLCTADVDNVNTAITALSNLANEETAKVVVSSVDAVLRIQHILSAKIVDLLPETIWLVGNLYETVPDVNMIQPSLVPELLEFFDVNEQGLELVGDSARALSCALRESVQDSNLIRQEHVVKRTIHMIQSASDNLMIAGLRVAQELVVGNEQQVESVLQLGLLKAVMDCLPSKGKVQKYGWRTIVNLTAGSASHLQACVEANVIARAVAALDDKEVDAKTKLAVVEVIANIARNGSPLQFEHLIHNECLQSLERVLSMHHKNEILVLECLEAIQALKKRGMSSTSGATILERIKSSRALQKLKKHKSTQIRKKASSLIS